MAKDTGGVQGANGYDVMGCGRGGGGAWEMDLRIRGVRGEGRTDGPRPRLDRHARYALRHNARYDASPTAFGWTG